MLEPGIYNIPFDFSIPSGSPPSVGMIGFVKVYFTVQYKIVVEEILSQPVVFQLEQQN